MTQAIWIFSTLGLMLATGLASAMYLVGRTHRLAGRPRPDESVPGRPVPLSHVPPDRSVQVAYLDDRCTGTVRRRLLDLGLTRGARLWRELAAPFGGMHAYRVRGTLIALRNDQARHVWVKTD